MSPPKGARARLAGVDALKGLAIVGVLLAHMDFRGRFDAAALAWVARGQAALGWCVLAFFFAAGLLAPAPRDTAGLGDFLIRRFRRLIVPCVVFGITYRVLIAGLAALKVGSIRPDTPWSGLGLVEFLLRPMGPQFYFMPYLFAIALAGALLELAGGVRALAFAGAAACLAAVWAAPGPLAPYGAAADLIPYYAAAYGMGRALSPKGPGRDGLALAPWLAFLGAACLLQGARVPAYTLAPAPLYLALTALPRADRLLERTRLGRYSGGIYVWHAPLLMPALSLVCARYLQGAPLVAALLTLTILACVLIQKGVSRVAWLGAWDFQ